MFKQIHVSTVMSKRSVALGAVSTNSNDFSKVQPNLRVCNPVQDRGNPTPYPSHAERHGENASQTVLFSNGGGQIKCERSILCSNNRHILLILIAAGFNTLALRLI